VQLKYALRRASRVGIRAKEAGEEPGNKHKVNRIVTGSTRKTTGTPRVRLSLYTPKRP
jgi:hypothetical protein